MMFTYLIFTLIAINTCESSVNRTCAVNSDCPANSSCEPGHVCFCNLGFIDHVIHDTLTCIKEATRYGEECIEDSQCTGLLGLHSHCHGRSDAAAGHCICSVGHHYKAGICIRSSLIGDACVVSDECVVRSADLAGACERGVCTCPPAHVTSPDRTNCLPAAGLNERCEWNVTCLVPHSKCDEICLCQLGYVQSQDKRRCLPAADSLNDRCEEDAQCTEFLKLSRCDTESGKCGCLAVSHRLHDQCWITVGLEGLCEDEAECSVDGDRTGVECTGVCACKKGFTRLRTSCVPISQARFGGGSSGTALSLQNHSITAAVVLHLISRFLHKKTP